MRTTGIAICVVSLLGLVMGCARQQEAGWIQSWSASQQLVEPRNQPPVSLAHAVLRQVVRLTVGSDVLVVHFSNAFGERPLAINAVHIAFNAGDGRIDPVSDRQVKFGGHPDAVIPTGSELLSDPVSFGGRSGQEVAVTIEFGDVPMNITGHPGSRETSFLAVGGAPSAIRLVDAQRVTHWYVLSCIDAKNRLGSRCLVVLGDSIADGRGSETDKNNRWPDDVARRFPAIGVINAGIGGNRLLSDGLGPSALARFDRDVATVASGRWLIVSEGVNDIGTSPSSEIQKTTDAIIEAYRQMVARGRRLGLKVYGATILPFGGSSYDTPEYEVARERINAWIRAAPHFDAVIDFDEALRDPTVHSRLDPGTDSGDHLHPNVMGYQRMADAIDPSLLAP